MDNNKLKYRVAADSSGGQSAVMDFAAAELARYIKEIVQGCEVVSAESLGGSDIYLAAGDAAVARFNAGGLVYDGFAFVKREGSLVIVSRYARGVLFGVYELLYRNGCRFVKAAGVKEKIPRRKSLDLDFEGIENPDYELRNIVISAAPPLDEAWAKETTEIVDWCCKNKINAVFLHENMDNSLTGGNRAVADQVKKRGMILEFGGHNAQNFVPRELFEEKPELFHMKNGRRAKDGNFCVSSPEACDMVVEAVRDFLKKNEGIDILHLWFDDAISDSWCSCEKCRNTPPISQHYAIIEKIAGAIREEFPDVKIDMLLYHETLDEIDKISRTEDNIVGVYAPRERCYAHSLGDETCENNRKYAEALRQAADSLGKNNIEIFEYYQDCILFSKNKVVIPHVIAQDMRDYHSYGIRQMGSLSFGEYSFWAYDLNFYVYARHMFHISAKVEETIAEYIEALGMPASFREYIDKLEEYSQKYFAFCGYNKIYADIRKLPLECGYYEEHLQKIGEANKVLAEAEALLEKFRREMPGNAYLKNEADIIKITRMESEGIFLRMTARLLNYKNKGADKGESVRKLEKVKGILYGIIDFYDTIPTEVKGVQGKSLFVEHLCKDQIWTVNELMNQELGLSVSLDRSLI